MKKTAILAVLLLSVLYTQAQTKTVKVYTISTMENYDGNWSDEVDILGTIDIDIAGNRITTHIGKTEVYTVTNYQGSLAFRENYVQSVFNCEDKDGNYVRITFLTDGWNISTAFFFFGSDAVAYDISSIM